MNSDKLISETKTRMQKALEHLREELSGVRTGRANPALLETVKVEVYGTRMDLRDLASINAPEPRLLVVQVWDQSNMVAIEKAIRESELSLNPVTEGNLIRVPIPPLSEERRKEMVKIVHEKAEAARVSIRQIRREVIEEIDKAEKRKEIPEDDKFRFHEQVQKTTDEISRQVEDIVKVKEKELSEV
ncbi:MAG: ribosome recycling factor [Candidatus Woykebacteria bacterium GWB1_45_5]|uniref:Ribosome-recycling factor n=2 Tax=Candidatus Woykeibacteriota TaxID=1817899 RepID=A0A1G1W0S1_9BACT|nr:MAG: ribosome recycling factor [Candidatus Woykebacteria bacterium GWA1_44_8]OGY22492.1 MAG: ribosome recycling factor [Candidatus Woykebacteria bacterium GWB1_45_5]